jgi:hypothetical protein
LTNGGSGGVAGEIATIDPAAVGAPRSTDIRMRVFFDDGRPPYEEIARNVVIDASLRHASRRRFAMRADRAPFREHLTLADLDGDGASEILVAYDDLASVVRVDGSDAPGWPQPVAPTLPTSLGYAMGAPVAADLDGDGRLEVIVGVRSHIRNRNDLSHESIMVWHADGTPMAGWPLRNPGVVWSARAYEFNPLSIDTGIAAADVDGDGTAELVVVWRQRLHVLRGDGTELPGFPQIDVGDINSAASFEGSPAVGDVDGDGVKEIAVAQRRWHLGDNRVSQYLHVLRGDGSQLEGWPRRISNRGAVSNPSPIFADLDGDGRLDVSIGSDRATKSAAFTASGKRLRLDPPRIPLWLASKKLFFPLQGSLAAGDLNADGRADLFVPTGSYMDPTKGFGYFVMLDYMTALRAGSAAGQTFLFQGSRSMLPLIPGPATIADLDGDGRQDLIVALSRYGVDDPSGISVARFYSLHALDAAGAPLPGFPKATPASGPFAYEYFYYGAYGVKPGTVAPALGDLDGDGLEEMVFVDSLGDLMIWTLPGTPGPKHHEWPMIRHDAGHTGTLPVLR